MRPNTRHRAELPNDIARGLPSGQSLEKLKHIYSLRVTFIHGKGGMLFRTYGLPRTPSAVSGYAAVADKKLSREMASHLEKFGCFETGSCSPGWSRTHHIAGDDFELTLLLKHYLP